MFKPRGRSAPPTPQRCCVHCGRKRACGAKQLCRACYQDPQIRDLYAGKGTASRLGANPPQTPTDALPGTPARVEAMARRVENREHLYHPDDARIDLD